MAGELAAEGKSVLLVDADSYGASVAAVLGLLDESAGLAQACRLADQGVLDPEALLRIATPVATKLGTFRVLTGITRADRWTELRAAALSLVLECARNVADVVVVDTGFCLEADEELSFDTMAPERQLRDAWERYGPTAGIHAFLPADVSAADSALLAGSLLLESCPDSKLRAAIARLVCASVQQKPKSSVFSSTARRLLKG
jgi:Flp pilus assembly CpaE family ATPase